ncbi:MAG: NAD(P)-dependent alcohol dehydrogenase [Acidimicrobiia bacterium]
MKAITQHRYGGTDTLELEERAEPRPGPHEVLVAVRAAGIGRETWHLLHGLPYLMRLAGFGVRAPKQPIPGRDVSGTVTAVGSAVTRFAPGDDVLGIGTGAFAELALAREQQLVPKPAGIGFAQAAIVGVSGSAAVEAVHRHGRVQAGQRVAIVGASGGVGTFAVQLAVAAGAEVTGVCSGAKAELVRSLGARHIIDHTRQDLPAADAAPGERFDVIVDIGGNRPVRRLRQALTPRGTLVIVGGEGGDRVTGGTHRQLGAVLRSPFTGQRLTTFVSRERGEDLALLAESIEQGRIVPVLDRTWSLVDAAEAIEYLEAGRARGKVALTV